MREKRKKKRMKEDEKEAGFGAQTNIHLLMLSPFYEGGDAP